MAKSRKLILISLLSSKRWQKKVPTVNTYIYVRIVIYCIKYLPANFNWRYVLSKVGKKLGDFFQIFVAFRISELYVRTFLKMGRKSKYVHTLRDFWRLYMQGGEIFVAIVGAAQSICSLLKNGHLSKILMVRLLLNNNFHWRIRKPFARGLKISFFSSLGG